MTKALESSGAIFADQTEHAKATRFRLKLIKVTNCFLDGDGSYTGNLLIFREEAFQNNHFLKPKKRKGQLVVQMKKPLQLTLGPQQCRQKNRNRFRQISQKQKLNTLCSRQFFKVGIIMLQRDKQNKKQTLIN